MAWHAEKWRGKITRVERVRLGVTLDEREQGLTPTMVHEPSGHCAICGAVIWHHWVFTSADGDTLMVGDECAEVATGGEPPSQLADRLKRESLARDEQREQRAEATRRRNWWMADEQRELRRQLVTGAWVERGGLGSWWRQAMRAARAGRMTEAWRNYAMKYPAAEAARNAKRAMFALRILGWCRLGRFDSEPVRDLTARLMPTDLDHAWGCPISPAQYAMIQRIAKRYRKQASTAGGSLIVDHDRAEYAAMTA